MADRLKGVRFIINETAGRGRADLTGLLENALGRSAAADLHYTEHRGHAEEIARGAARDGYDLVVAVGGDGTINEVARTLLHTQTALGVIPTGSGNAIARTFGIPLDPLAACRFLLDASRPDCLHALDVGFISNLCFVSTAGIGVDAAVCSLYAQRRGRRGLLPYVSSSLRAFARFHPEEVTITVDGGTAFRARPALVTVANSAQFGYGAVIAPGARPDDGVLDLCVFEGLNAPRLLWHSRRLFTGGIDKTPGLRRLQARTVRIERANPGPIQVDGEAFDAEAALDIRVDPGALRVLAPG